ncbi:MAG: hypothetical protein IT178_16660, partial [Acidobacteria bacterium]|nr:hypothetical protein [Acidobacteriota bacterium]
MVGILAGMSCRDTALPADTRALATRYVTLTRELARHDPSLIDHWLIPPPPLTGPRQPVAPLETAIAALRRDVDAERTRGDADEATRLDHLAGQLRALHLAARRLLGHASTFDEEARDGLGIDTLRIDEAAAADARALIDRELPGAQPLVDRLAAFRARFIVAPDRRQRVLDAAVAACDAATRDAWTLPPDQRLVLRIAGALPWDAHARYDGHHQTTVEVNGARPLDLSRAVRVACHEGHAGHHAQYIWIADVLIGERGWQEFALVPGFGPDLLLAEGAAEAATDLALPAETRLALYRDVLAPAAGLPATDLDRLVRIEDAQARLEPLIGLLARDYLDNRANAARTMERLAAEALVA